MVGGEDKGKKRKKAKKRIEICHVYIPTLQNECDDKVLQICTNKNWNHKIEGMLFPYEKVKWESLVLSGNGEDIVQLEVFFFTGVVPK